MDLKEAAWRAEVERCSPVKYEEEHQKVREAAVALLDFARRAATALQWGEGEDDAKLVVIEEARSAGIID